jgi:hypothetical protein
VCVQRKRERERAKTERIFFEKKMNSHQKIKNKIKKCPGTRAQV